MFVYSNVVWNVGRSMLMIGLVVVVSFLIVVISLFYFDLIDEGIVVFDYIVEINLLVFEDFNSVDG